MALKTSSHLHIFDKNKERNTQESSSKFISSHLELKFFIAPTVGLIPDCVPQE